MPLSIKPTYTSCNIMGRNRAPPPAPPRPAAAAHKPAPPPAPAAHKPAPPPPPQQQHHAPPPQQQQAPPTPTHVVFVQPQAATASRGPGLMGTMAAAAAGSVAGNMITNSLMGGGSHQPAAPAAPAPQQATAPAASNDPCAAQFQAYSKCLENNGTMETCSWAWNMVTQCRTQNGLKA